jgi:spore coat protein U-like protein
MRPAHAARVAAALLGAAAGAAWAQAGSVSCALIAPPIAFGAYDTLAPSPAPPVSGVVVLECTRLGGVGAQRVDYRIAAGKGGAPTYFPRQLRRAGTPPETLDYNLFLESLGAVWGDGTAGTVTATGRMVVNPGQPTRSREHRVLGQIPARQAVSAGTYQDSVVVTVSFD